MWTSGHRLCMSCQLFPNSGRGPAQTIHLGEEKLLGLLVVLLLGRLL